MQAADRHNNNLIIECFFQRNTPEVSVGQVLQLIGFDFIRGSIIRSGNCN